MNLDQFQSERLDPAQQAVQRGQVLDGSVHDCSGRLGLDGEIELFELGRQSSAEPTPNGDLVVRGSHRGTHTLIRPMVDMSALIAQLEEFPITRVG
jgi:hypothetical protein